MTNRAGRDVMSGALTGTLIVEWSAGRAGGYAGKMLRGLGSEVILLEPEEGAGGRAQPKDQGDVSAREFAARARFLHGGKRSVAFDPKSEADRDLAFSLLEKADALLMDQPLRFADEVGMSPETLAEQFPHLIVVSMSLFGLNEANRYRRYSDLVAHAVGGLARGTPSHVPDPATDPPLKPGGYQADYTMGLVAANSVMLGLRLRRRTNTGHLVDLSAQEVLAGYLRMDVAFRTYAHSDSALHISSGDRRSANGQYSTLAGLVPCKDGYFAFQASEQYQWEGLMKVMGNPEWSRDPRFQEPMDRMTYWDEIEPHFVAWCLEHTKTEIFHESQANHVPVFPCYSVAELLTDEQQIARAFFIDMPGDKPEEVIKVPGAVIHLDKTPWVPDFEPPAVGADTTEFRNRYRGQVRQ